MNKRQRKKAWRKSNAAAITWLKECARVMANALNCEDRQWFTLRLKGQL